MRPNTPHLVVTPEHAICHGGHFYAMATIRDTCFGIYHTFVAGTNLTNTEYSLHASQMLTRMLFFIQDSLIRGDDEVEADLPCGNLFQYQFSSFNFFFSFKISRKCIFPIPRLSMASSIFSPWSY